MRLLRIAFVCIGALIALSAHPARAAGTWSTWDTSRIIRAGAVPVFTVDGKPFYVYGAAFFYERIPRDRWRIDLERYKTLGINTIDLYLIWNWHEPAPNVVDFDGHTNPRRNLRALFSIIHQLGFKVIVRPGPVIRNEWRNGGYPDWLLERPAYDMPLHDVLAGRYPATATLQNAHADAAAAQWLANRTHLHYASRWLHDVLHAIAPWSHDVIAIALDDDQGAYIDNDTWPAPHWHHYIEWLKRTVQHDVGTRVPLFINTYQTKVPSALPVWGWGNWYQSDAYRIGDHDLAQIAFSFGTLQTQPSEPLMASEFQAGWLQGADEATPRAAAPENTTLALHEMLQQGVRGVVNFPVQDTLDPAGWEAPWANWFYAWGAAFDLQGNPSPRFAPTAAFGALVHMYGPTLATMHVRSNVGIAWLGDAYDPAQMTNLRFAQLAAATIAAQQGCRARALACRVIDLHATPFAQVRRLRAVIVPALPGLTLDALAARTLDAYRHTGGVVAPRIDEIHHVRSVTAGLHDAALLVTPNGRSGLLDIFNARTTVRTTPRVTIALGVRRFSIPPLLLAPGTARDLPLGIAPATTTPLPQLATIPRTNRRIPIAPGAWLPAASVDDTRDIYRDGEPTYVLDNGTIRVVIAADAGARVLLFERDGTHRNLLPTIGALRDASYAPIPPSPRDYIAPYTHPLQAGTFNRAYACTQRRRSIDCSYTAPDLGTAPITFDKRFTLDGASLVVAVRASAPASSLSALGPALRASVTPRTGVLVSRTPHLGMTFLRVRYPAATTVHVRLFPQGAAPSGTNRP